MTFSPPIFREAVTPKIPMLVAPMGLVATSFLLSLASEHQHRVKCFQRVSSDSYCEESIVVWATTTQDKLKLWGIEEN